MADLKKNFFSKNLIIILAATVVILLVLGVGAFFFMKGGSSEGEEIEALSDKSVVPKEKLYFDISKPVIVDFPKGSVVKHGRISVSMLIEDVEIIGVLKKNEPMILNNLLMLIGAQDSAVLNTGEGKEMLRKAILEDVNAVLKKVSGKGQVEDIFFTSFVMQ
jgi:flagellar FliL protein